MIYPPNVRCHRSSLCSQRVWILLPCSLECVCSYVCVCGLVLMVRLWPISFYLTMAAEVVEQWASSDRDITHTYITCAQKPTPWVSGGETNEKKGWGGIYWLMMSPGGNVLEGYHAGLGTGRSFLHLFLHSAPCKIPMLADNFIKFTVEQ